MMGSKKIIVPQGLINPNETTIIEIPAGVDSEATLIARSNPDDYTLPNCPASPRRLAASTRDSPSFRKVKKVTSITTTEIESGPPSSSFTQSPGRQTINRNHSRYMERSLPPNQLYPLYMNPASTASKYSNQTRRELQNEDRPNCLPGCADQTCPAATFRPQSARQRPAQPPYQNTLPPPPQQSKTQATPPQITSIKKVYKKVVTEGSSSDLKFQPPFNSTAITPNESYCIESCPGSTARVSARKYRAVEPRGTYAPRETSRDMNQTNLTEEVKKHLADIEISEKEQINRDLELFQQARRKLVEDTTKLSSSKENDLMRMPPKYC